MSKIHIINSSNFQWSNYKKFQGSNYVPLLEQKIRDLLVPYSSSPQPFGCQDQFHGGWFPHRLGRCMLPGYDVCMDGASLACTVWFLKGCWLVPVHGPGDGNSWVRDYYINLSLNIYLLHCIKWSAVLFKSWQNKVVIVYCHKLVCSSNEQKWSH